MMKQGFVIDTTRNVILKTGHYDTELVDGMFLKFDGELLPVAYVFPIEHKESIQELLNQLAKAKKEYDDTVARIYYKEFQKFR